MNLGDLQDDVDGGTVGIRRVDLTRERRPWKLVFGEPWDRGDLAGCHGKPWRAAEDEQVIDRRRDAGLELDGWNDRGDDCGRITRNLHTDTIR